MAIITTNIVDAIRVPDSARRTPNTRLHADIPGFFMTQA
jgi:hypothetical protein